MKMLKAVAQNIFSGCVGGLLVMSAAQAQKTADVTPQNEVRTHKLAIVDEENKECGVFAAIDGNTFFRLGTDNSFVQLSASDKSGPALSLGKNEKRFVMIEVNDNQSGITVSSNKGTYGAVLNATDENSNFALLKAGSKEIVSASVDNEGSNLVASGFKSGLAVADQNGYTKASLNWDNVNNFARLSIPSKPSSIPSELSKAKKGTVTGKTGKSDKK